MNKMHGKPWNENPQEWHDLTWATENWSEYNRRKVQGSHD